MKGIQIKNSIMDRSEPSLGRYLREISKYPLLTIEEEVELAIKIGNGDMAAKERFIKGNTRFAVSVANKYKGKGLSTQDLIAEGNIGLIRAVNRFDHTRGFKFISLAVWYIRQAIISAIKEQNGIIRLPMNQVNEIHKIYKAELELEQIYQRIPTLEEIANHCNLPVEKIESYMYASEKALPLDSAVGDGDKPGLIDVLEDLMFDNPDTIFDNEDLLKLINTLILRLPKRQAQVIRLYYGLDTKICMQTDDIARSLNLSIQCIQMNKTKALQMLRKLDNIENLKVYLK